MNKAEKSIAVPIWERVNLTLEEASAYTGIGINRLRELADDLYTGCPMEQGNKLFDLDWDYKYNHGGQ